MENEKRLVSTWEMLYKDAEGEGHVETLHKYDHTPELSQDLFISQAPPLRITPSKRRKADSDWQESLVGIGDIHFPFQNKKRLALAQVGMRELMPDTIVLMGDNLDYSNYSRFETREEWRDSSQQGIEEYSLFLGQLRSDHPEARIIWHEGNHDLRMEKRIRDYNGDLLKIKRAGEELGALSLAFLLRTEDIGVEVINGYPASRETHRGVLETYHGNVTNSTGLACGKVIVGATTSFMTGHTHQLGLVSKTFNLKGKETTIYGAEAGTYASQELTPSGRYAPNRNQMQNWQTGLVYWLLDDEMAIPSIMPIDDSSITVFNRRYTS